MILTLLTACVHEFLKFHIEVKVYSSKVHLQPVVNVKTWTSHQTGQVWGAGDVAVLWVTGGGVDPCRARAK